MSERLRAPEFPGRKIAFFLSDLGGGGAERVQLAVIRHLITRGHQVDLILAFEGGVLLPLLPPEVRIIEFRCKRLATSLPRLVHYLRTERPHSLQAIMWPCTIVAVAARAMAMVPTKLMLTDHVALSMQYRTLRERLAVRASLRFFYRRAEAVAAVSRGAATDNERLGGFPLGSIKVIYNPMNLPPAPTSDAAAEAAWGGASPRIITVGRLKDQKNHALLIRAFSRLLKVHPNARLLILGEGALRPQLEQLRAELDLEESVHLPGFAIDPWSSLVSADLFVLSSDYEGLPLVLIEAMHAGLRVVSTDCVSGPNELLDGGKFGRLVPVGDEQALANAMVEELALPACPKRQRARAQEIVGSGSLERYEEILAG